MLWLNTVDAAEEVAPADEAVGFAGAGAFLDRKRMTRYLIVSESTANSTIVG